MAIQPRAIMNPSPARLQALATVLTSLPSSYPSQRVSAGDLDNLTGHPSGLLACEQHDASAISAGVPRRRSGMAGKSCCSISAVAGLYGTWRDGIDRNAEGTQLARHVACQRLERELGSAITNLRRECASRIERML
jgi:hypothetical protein